jgi:hypothetical protein
MQNKKQNKNKIKGIFLIFQQTYNADNPLCYSDGSRFLSR